LQIRGGSAAPRHLSETEYTTEKAAPLSGGRDQSFLNGFGEHKQKRKRKTISLIPQ
jgi:hypothetical protein